MSINESTSRVQADTGSSEQTYAAHTNAASPSMRFGSGVLFGAPISRTVGSENYTKLKNALVELYQQSDATRFEIQLLDLDNVNETALAFSSIIVAVRLKEKKNNAVAYHIVTMAGSGEKLAPTFENINSQQVEILHVTSDAIDNVLLDKAIEKIRKAFPSSVPYFCDATVLPADFPVEDKVALHRLGLNSVLACTTELEVRSEGFVDVNLAAMPRDASLNINLTFNRAQVPDAVGNPMRSDIQVKFASKRNQPSGRNASVNSGDRESRLFSASAFTDMVWAPVAQPQGFNGYAPAQPLQTQKYISRLVVTDLSSDFSYTPASILLALMAAQTVREDNNWIQSFRPMSLGGEVDITDVGALNIEANLTNDPSGFGTRIDTKADSFKLADLGRLMATLVQPGMIVSLDCPEYGPQSWYTSVFIAAANGVPEAVDIIFNAAQSLTNGNFSRHFPQASEMFIDLNNRVHLGYWTDRTGSKRDIRDIDHVAVCNLAGESSPHIIRDWSDTFLRKDYPLPLRLAARKRIISSLTQEKAVYTGFAQRVTFSRAFMEALSRGVNETGLPVRIQTPLSGSDFNDQRAVATFGQAGLLAPAQTFHNNGFNQGYAPQGPYGVAGMHRFG
jgi:hypothetical protein